VNNMVLVFVLTMFCSIFLLLGLGVLVGGDDIEFTYVTLFLVQFSFTTAMLFKIYDKVKRLEEKHVEKKRKLM
jgi:hypothetical protein